LKSKNNINTFQALWHFAEGLFLFFINYFAEKERFVIDL